MKFPTMKFLENRNFSLKMRCLSGVLLLLSVLLLNFEALANSQALIKTSFQPLNRISGFIFGTSRTPISRVFVELQDELNRTLSTVRTDSTGRYVFSGMSDGTFFIRVIPTGTNFQEQTIRVQVVNLGSRQGGFGQSDDVTQDFYLKTKNDSKNRFEPGVLFVQDIPAPALASYKKAVAAVESQNLEIGINHLKEALKAFPTYFIALNRLGYIYLEKKKYAKASEFFAKAADVNPKSEPTVFLLAYSVFQTKRYDATITILQGALGLKHETARIYLLFGKCFRMNKNYQDAEKALLLAEKIDTSNDPEIHWMLAKLYGSDLKQFGKAAKHLKKFLELQPDSKDKEDIQKLIEKFEQKSRINNK